MIRNSGDQSVKVFFPDFVELKLLKLMVVDASKTCGLHTFGPACGGGGGGDRPFTPSLKNEHADAF